MSARTLLLPALLSVLCAAADAAEVRARDVDGDGLPDKLLVADDGALTLKLNRGHQRYDELALDVALDALVSVLVSDLDGDGLDDLYLVTLGPNRVLLGRGAGRYVEAPEGLGLADAGPGRGAERIDLDGLGRDDLLLHNAAGDVLFYADGGRFVADVDTPPLTAEPSALAAAGPTLGSDELAWLRRLMLFVDLEWIPGPGGLTELPTLRITGANLQLVNGLGATNGHPADPTSCDPDDVATNGLGNLVIGYNEDTTATAQLATGSHNLLLGHGQSYTSFGGVATGNGHLLAAPHALALGGQDNRVLKEYASAYGGREQVIDAAHATAMGGEKNLVTGQYGVAVAGFRNRVRGRGAVAVGGRQNDASGEDTAALGGRLNVLVGPLSCIAGGRENQTVSLLSSITGGSDNLATGGFAVVSGGRDNRAVGQYASVAGGAGNEASGLASSVSGGSANEAAGAGASVGGGRKNRSFGDHAFVAGGVLNQAAGDSSTVSGGRNRTAPDVADWVAGTLLEDK